MKRDKTSHEQGFCSLTGIPDRMKIVKYYEAGRARQTMNGINVNLTSIRTMNVRGVWEVTIMVSEYRRKNLDQ